jgi:hypothetical protein
MAASMQRWNRDASRCLRTGIYRILQLFSPRPDLQPMPAEFISAIAFLGGALVTMVATCQAVSRGSQLQQEILKRGAAAQGRILRVWRPPLFGAFPRVYFEFEPDEVGASVQTCHIDRRTFGELSASLPPVGACVGVRYLPESPTKAVIAKLVSRFTD